MRGVGPIFGWPQLRRNLPGKTCLESFRNLAATHVRVLKWTHQGSLPGARLKAPKGAHLNTLSAAEFRLSTHTEVNSLHKISPGY